MNDESLNMLFTSSARVAMLRVFMLDPVRSFYQRQLEAGTGLPIRAVQRELEKLTAIGLLFRRSEGNRIYYHTDSSHPLYPELRAIILKCSGPVDRLRAGLAADPAARAAFLHEEGDRVLVITQDDQRLSHGAPPGVELEVLPFSAFVEQLAARREVLESYLALGVDLLGRRDDILWRHIEAAGYTVAKGAGVP